MYQNDFPMLWDHEAAGSIPVTRTITKPLIFHKNQRFCYARFLFRALCSRRDDLPFVYQTRGISSLSPSFIWLKGIRLYCCRSASFAEKSMP